MKNFNIKKYYVWALSIMSCLALYFMVLIIDMSSSIYDFFDKIIGIELLIYVPIALVFAYFINKNLQV